MDNAILDDDNAIAPHAVKLTFNKPAQSKFFDDDSATGIVIKMEGDTPFFRAATGNPGEGTVFEFEARPRGGYETVVSGDIVPALFHYLTKDATVARPFFLINKVVGNPGWMTVQHFDKDGAPPKFEPHMRLWFVRDRADNGVRAPINDEIAALLGPFTSVVRAAKQVVSNYDLERRIGRPPAEVLEARGVLDAFQTLVTEIVGGGGADDTVKTIETALAQSSALTVMLGETLKQVRTTQNAIAA